MPDRKALASFSSAIGVVNIGDVVNVPSEFVEDWEKAGLVEKVAKDKAKEVKEETETKAAEPHLENRSVTPKSKRL